jgi:hypothetical protein
MRILTKETFEYDDGVILSVKGEEAIKLQNHNTQVAVYAQVHGCNPFEYDPINWEYDIKQKIS